MTPENSRSSARSVEPCGWPKAPPRERPWLLRQCVPQDTAAEMENSTTASREPPRALRQRSSLVDARTGLAEQVVDLAGQEQHRDDQKNRNRGDDEAALDESLTSCRWRREYRLVCTRTCARNRMSLIPRTSLRIRAPRRQGYGGLRDAVSRTPSVVAEPTAQLANWSIGARRSASPTPLEPQRIAISIGCSASLEVQTRAGFGDARGTYRHPLPPGGAGPGRRVALLGAFAESTRRRRCSGSR